LTPSPDSSALGRLLSRRPRQPVKWGLERIEFMLEGLGGPQDGLRVIHVGGTNGKGTVVAAADAILRAAGHFTGRYTSPHLVSFSERITVGGRPVAPDLLESCAADILPLAEQVDATFFEATTALGLLAFAREDVHTAVVEVGLGGRLDATNALDGEVSVVTSIALDHAEYLGSDLAGIAAEKAGILRAGRPAIIGPVTGDAGRALRAAAADVGAREVLFDRDYGVGAVESDGAGTSLVYHSRRRPTGLVGRSPVIGRHQAANLAIAIAAVEEFTDGSIEDAAIIAGLEGLSWPGRFQVENREDGTWVYDIAHNPAAASALADVMSSVELTRPIVILAAVLGDKPAREVIGPLLSVAEHAVLTVAPSSPDDRRWDPEAAATALADLGSVEVMTDFDAALAAARERAGRGTVLVAGSCHTVGDAMRRNETA